MFEQIKYHSRREETRHDEILFLYLSDLRLATLLIAVTKVIRKVDALAPLPNCTTGFIPYGCLRKTCEWQCLQYYKGRQRCLYDASRRVTAPPPTTEILATAEIPPAVEILPAVEISPSETMQTQEMMSTSRYSIPANWENLLNEKVDEVIARMKNRERPITVKEDPLIEELMSIPLPLKLKEPIGDFDGTTDPIDHIRTIQDRVRLHCWPDAIACRAFPMTLRKYTKEWFDTLPP
ncbi:Retrotransposon gag domain-containing protein [Forsythia ovata]|uniref:Retrotransposon gag domain-containing protein n=1 Tax=Forsythia ovata TaxID=205694 RepID=A0ABD1SK50_9LAMI